jgi:hypothetical protein
MFEGNFLMTLLWIYLNFISSYENFLVLRKKKSEKSFWQVFWHFLIFNGLNYFESFWGWVLWDFWAI